MDGPVLTFGIEAPGLLLPPAIFCSCLIMARLYFKYIFTEFLNCCNSLKEYIKLKIWWKVSTQTAESALPCHFTSLLKSLIRCKAQSCMARNFFRCLSGVETRFYVTWLCRILFIYHIMIWFVMCFVLGYHQYIVNYKVNIHNGRGLRNKWQVTGLTCVLRGGSVISDIQAKGMKNTCEITYAVSYNFVNLGQ